MRPGCATAGGAAFGGLIFAAAPGGCSAAGSQTATPALDQIGCRLESKGICEQAMARPVHFASGITTGNQSDVQQNAPATVWEQVPIKAPGGSELDVPQCQVNTQNKTVIYAYAAPSGGLSDRD